MADSALSRRLNEITGVVLFAVALLWVIALVSYTDTDPVWFPTGSCAKLNSQLRSEAAPSTGWRQS